MLTHHAQLLEDSTSLFDAYRGTIRAIEGFDGDEVNFFSRKYEKFGIEDARELQTLASLKRIGHRALFVIAISSITTEAQQALLKLFEEPQEGVFFILITPPGLFIQTLKSRFLAYTVERPKTKDVFLAETFLKSSYKERSDMAAEMLDVGDEEDVKEKVREFLNALETVLAPKLKDSADIRKSLEDIAKFRSYVQDRSPSLKMILEHFAATLPTI